MDNEKVLGTNRRDIAAAVARGTLGAIPVVGSAVAEAVSAFIPGQKLERVTAFVEELSRNLQSLSEKQAILEERLRTPEGSDLLEEGILQASRAISPERRRRIANIVTAGMVDRDLKYDRTKKLLDILGSLTDSELLLLTYYAKTPTFGSSHHNHLQQEYPDVLRPVSREIGAPQAEVERGAFRDSYERTLIGYGLLDRSERGTGITALGRLLLKAAGDDGVGSVAPAP